MSTLVSAAPMDSASAAPVTPAVPLSERRLPEVLTLSSGQRVSSAQEWRARRGEILELFRAHVFGRAPVGRPASLSFTLEKIDPNAMDGQATLKQVAIKYLGAGGVGRINLVLFVPNKRSVPAPAFLLINNRSPKHIDPARVEKSGFWPAEALVARGYAAAAFLNSDVDEDKDDGFRDGVHGIFDPPRPTGAERPGDAWATIAAWAWGASRVMDYLETDGDIDARRVAAVGHSRGGKTSLWAGAQDERFAMTVSNNSGSTGAALARGNAGEKIADINRGFPYWFAANYKKFNGRPEALPVDQHQLIALMAPRPVYIASAAADAWADPFSEFLSGVAASPVYKLLGREGLPESAVASMKLPPLDAPLHEGSIGFHIRPGGHGLLESDWKQFMDFADARGLGAR
jgi:dienelactone hydrolase